MRAAVNLIRATIGTGVLAMPSAVKDAGLLFGTVGLFICSLIIVHSMHCLLGVVRYLRILNYQTFDVNSPMYKRYDYKESVKLAFLQAPWPRINRLSSIASYIIYASLLLAQFGFVIVYLLFIAQNIHQMLMAYMPTESMLHNTPLFAVQIAVHIVFLPFSFINSLYRIAPISVLANILIYLCMAAVLFFNVTNLPADAVTRLPLMKSWDTIPIFMGVTIFGFESINVLLPVENQMKNPQDLSGTTGIINVSMLPSVAIYTAIGFYGYLCWGESVASAMIYSMPVYSPWPYALVRPIYSLCIFFSLILHFYILFLMIWSEIAKVNCLKSHIFISTRRSMIFQYVLRIILLLIGSICAIFVPYIDLIISLMGSLAGSNMTFIFPALCHFLVVCAAKKNFILPYGDFRFYLVIVKDVLVIVFGVFAMFFGTYTSIVQLNLRFSLDN